MVMSAAKTVSRLILLCAPVLLGGCTSLFVGSRADEPELSSAEITRKACPLGVPSTRIRVADTSGGVALGFSTTMSGVEDLRRRVRDQARASGPNRHVGAGHDGRHGGAHDHGLQLWSMGELKTAVADTPSGITLTIAPVDPQRRAEVKRLVVERVALLESRGCGE